VLTHHTFKAGFDYSNDDILNYYPGNFSGSYTFDSIANYQHGKPSRFLQAFAGPGTSGATTHPNITETGLFVEDAWRVLPNLTVNLGIRYDFQGIEQPEVQNPDAQLLAAGIDTSVVPEDENNIGPRLGFAWTPGADGRTIIRGGYGIFYGRTPAIMIGTAHSNNGINVQTITFTGALIPTIRHLHVASDGRHASEADDLRVRSRLPEPRGASGQHRRRARARAGHQRRRDGSARAGQQSAALDRCERRRVRDRQGERSRCANTRARAFSKLPAHSFRAAPTRSTTASR
jgi:hypothetical protein